MISEVEIAEGARLLLIAVPWQMARCHFEEHL